MPVSPPPLVARALQRLDDAPERPTTLAELAALSGVSRFQLLRGFSRAVGTTPHAYLVQQRVQLARRLLLAGHRPADAAVAAGFADQSHLTRAFRRQLGVTPRPLCRRHGLNPRAIAFKTTPAASPHPGRPDMRDAMQNPYVHGYQAAETRRLNDQATTLAALLHRDTIFPEGSLVLEAGCGVGAQTVTLIRNSPGADFTCIDLSQCSLAEAEGRVQAAGLPLPRFRQADMHALPFADASFDHAFVCFVLEHLRDPASALQELRRVVRPGGTLTVIEGDHGSTLFHPDDPAAGAAIACQVALQRAAGGDASIGRRLYPLLVEAGLQSVRVQPVLVYADASRPALVQGFVRDTFTAMVAGVRDEAIRAGLTDTDGFEAGIRALLRTAEPNRVFCYTFFRVVGVRD